MRVHEADLVARANCRAEFPRALLPEIAFVGRSNVGKSSLLNALVGRRGMARTSSTPGCTRVIHFFALNRRLLFADLPGYGYTKVSRSLKESWRPLVESYLAGREPLRLVWQLVDSRHPPTEQDVQLVEWLQAEGIPLRVSLTKTDKLSQSERARCISRCRETMQLPADAPPVVTSARKGTGLPVMWKIIEDCIRSASRGPSGARNAPEPPPRSAAAGG
jgi:GTP-binding protein